MKKISLTKGKFTIVDDEDFKFLNQQSWYLSSHSYAVSGKSPHQYMHRIINKTPKGYLTDHINRNTLDNRKINLRIADKRINSINRDLQSNNTSGYKGISWNKQHRKWETYIWGNGIKIMLGFFKNFNKAVLIRKQAEEKYHAI